VTRPGNQAGQGRPGPDIHGWRCRKTSSLPVVFLPKSFEPQQALNSTNKPNVSFGPMSFKQTPLRPPHPYPIVFPQLPTCCLSRFHVFMISELPYPTSLSSSRRLQQKNQKKNPSSTSAGSSWRRRLTAQPNVFQQRGNVKWNLKKIQSPKEKNTCVLKRGNPRSLSEEESPKWRLSGATSGTIVFHW